MREAELEPQSRSESDVPDVPARLSPPPGAKGKTDAVFGNRFILGYQPDHPEGASYFVAPRGLRSASKATRYPLDDTGWILAWNDFALREPSVAAQYVEERAKRRAEKAAASPRAAAPPVPLLTIADLPGQEIAEVCGLVATWSVMSRNMFSDFGSDVHSLVGGNLGGVETAIGKAVSEVRAKAYLEAQRLGADAIVGVRMDLQTVSDKAQAIMLTGTAVRSH